MEYLIQKKRTLDRKKQGLILGIFISILFAVLIFRLVYLQIFLQSKFGELSEGNRIRLIPIKAPRGLIKDRNGEIIVDNYPSYTISLIPYQFQNNKSQEVIQKLSTIIDVPSNEIYDKLKKHFYRPFEPAPIMKNASFKIASMVEEQTLDLPGVIVQIEPRRRYRYKKEGAHMLGYLREISESEYEKLREEGYRFGDMIGKSGIEKIYENQLRGKDGIKFEEVTAYGQRLGPLSERPPILPIPGNDITIGIDWRTQQALENAFEEDMSGAAVAINPANGEVLAMVSKPSFDPNLFSKGILASDWRDLITDPKNPLLNRAVQSSYPPGSTFKLVTASAGLENDIISLEKSYMRKSCVGGFSYGNHWFGCWKKSGHGYLDVKDAIIQSCDTYFYQLGLKLGVDGLHDFAKKCHFGTLPQIDLPTGRAAKGLIPSSNWYDAVVGKGKWSHSVVISLSIGQGEILSSALQLAAFTAAIANDGTYYSPHIAKKIIHRPEEKRRNSRRPKKKQDTDTASSRLITAETSQLPLSNETLELIQEAMKDVVNAPRGTAHRAIIQDVTVAGKTGTSQNPHGDDHAWFCAYAPFEKPIIAIAVVAENAGHGGAVAAPIARKGLEAYLRIE